MDEKGNYYPKVKTSITEHMIMYRIKMPWIDTNNMNASLEAGIIQANMLLNNLEKADVFELYEKTFGLNHIRIGRDTKGRRVIFPTVIHNSLDFLHNNTGDKVFPIEISCPKYNTPLIEGMFQLWGVKNLYAHYSSDSNKHYLYVINRSPNEVAEVSVDTEILKIFDKYQVYELSSEHYLDYNSADKPDNVNYRLINDSIKDNIINVKPHSLKVFIGEKVQNVSPNPDEIKFSVQKPNIRLFGLNNSYYKCEVYNILGEKLFSQISRNPEITLPEMPAGVYIINIKINDRNYRYKFLW